MLGSGVAEAVKQADKAGVEPGLDLGQLFRDYYTRIYNYARYRINKLEDAEDLVGTIFEQAYTHRNKFNPEKGAFSTWLFRIAHNELVNYYRKHQSRSKWETGVEPPANLGDDAVSLEAQVVHQETLVQLLQCLERLNERDQEVISLKFAGKLRNNEIAEILDMKEKTVSVVLLRAVRRLRQELEQEAGHE